MRIGEFIQANAATIIAAWERGLRASPASRGLGRPALVDHVPRLLEDFARVIETREQEPPLIEIADAHTDTHVVERIEQRFSAGDVVGELMLLRTCILRLWHASHPTITVDEAEVLSDVFDHAIRRSVDRFVERRSQLLEGFEQIADAAFNVEDLDTFLDHLLRIFRRFAPSIDEATILLRDGDRMRAVASVGLEDEVRQDIGVRIGEGFSGTIAATGRPLLLANACNDPLVESPVIRARAIRALYGVPLLDHDEVVGVAHIGCRSSHEIPPAEQHLFAALAQRATSAVIKHRLRARARRTTAALNAVAEAIPNAVFVGDRDRFTLANRAALHLLGLSRRDELDAPTSTLIAPLEMRDATTGAPIAPDETPYALAIERGEPCVRDLLLRDRATGAEQVVRSHAGPIRQEGRVVGAAAVLSDLTDVNVVLAELRQLVDNMPELSWTALPDGFVDFYNRRWYEYTGATFEQMQGWGWERVHDPSVLPEVVRRWKHSIATGVPFEMEYPLRGRDGVFRWFLSRTHPLRDADGRIVRWVGTITDVDEQRRLRRELHQALDDLERTAEFRERFIGIVSHDLRNPMNAIAMAGGLLADSAELPEDVRRLARRILGNVDRMTRMVSELLDFTRGRLGGGIPIDPEAIDLRHVARSVIDEFEQTHPARRIVFTALGDTSGTWDGERLAQVVGNLVGNALHHGRHDEPIDVVIEGRDDHVTLRVHNAGAPIPHDVLPHVFDPFRRARTPDLAEGVPAGLGLGLFIACEITRAHGGAIHVTSDAARGTTFTVTLPRARAVPPRSEP